MLSDQDLDLDHNEDRTGYRGLAHRSCNRQAGAIKGNQLRSLARQRGLNTSRDW